MKKLITTLLITATLTLGALAQQDFGILVFRHEIAMGMSFANVVAAWGKPTRVDRSYTSYGVTEYWFMSNNWLVVFTNGQVTSFHSF